MLPFKYHLCVRKASAWCGAGSPNCCCESEMSLADWSIWTSECSAVCWPSDGRGKLVPGVVQALQIAAVSLKCPWQIGAFGLRSALRFAGLLTEEES